MIRMIAAIDDARGLARQGNIPWRLPTDAEYYKNMTKGSPIAVGRNTFLKMGAQTLAARYSRVYVLSSQELEIPNGEAITDAEVLAAGFDGDLWVLGGGTVYAQFIDLADELYLTRVDGDFGCDVFFPEFEDKFDLAKDGSRQSENGINFRFQVWVRRV